jgi:hypothetical protein
MDSDHYVKNTLELFFEQLTDDEGQHDYCQEDNATANTQEIQL